MWLRHQALLAAIRLEEHHSQIESQKRCGDADYRRKNSQANRASDHSRHNEGAVKEIGDAESSRKASGSKWRARSLASNKRRVLNPGAE